jgi:uncharacterized protein
MRVPFLVIAASLTSPLVLAQVPDPQLMAAIESIKAIDDHAHVVAPDYERDKGYDALPCDTLPPGTALPPANVRFGPSLQDAWKALYGFAGESASPENLKRWQARQRAVRDERGAGYFDWVLDQAGIAVVLANRVAMASSLDPRRFRWVPYDDALLFPLDNRAQKAENPERAVLYEAEERLLGSYRAATGVEAMPATLDGYLQQVIAPTLGAQKEGGALAIKFEAAYLRSLDFEPASHEEAAEVYARYAGKGAPAPSEYKRLQDFLYRHVVARAGELGLAVHVHTGSGCGEYFDDRGSDPMLLEPVLNDPALRGVRFVLLHGGSPFDRHNLGLIVKPNVWVDTSVLELLFSPAELARILRPWLETMPERVIFGTDAGPFGPGMGWEETTWIGSRNARRALGIALTGMVQDGVVGPARAKEIAEGVLRGNAAALYGMK